MPHITLDASDIDDIQRLLPTHGTGYLAEYLGCSRSTIHYQAHRLGIGYLLKIRPTLSDEAKSMGTEVVSKVCSGCEQLKPLDKFHRSGRGRSDTYYLCIPCRSLKERTRRMQKKNPSAEARLEG